MNILSELENNIVALDIRCGATSHLMLERAKTHPTIIKVINHLRDREYLVMDIWESFNEIIKKPITPLDIARMAIYIYILSRFKMPYYTQLWKEVKDNSKGNSFLIDMIDIVL